MPRATGLHIPLGYPTWVAPAGNILGDTNRLNFTSDIGIYVETAVYLYQIRHLFLVMDLHGRLFMPYDETFGYDPDLHQHITVADIRVPLADLKAPTCAPLIEAIIEITRRIIAKVEGFTFCHGQICALHLGDGEWRRIMCEWLPDLYSNVNYHGSSLYHVPTMRFERVAPEVRATWPIMDIDYQSTIPNRQQSSKARKLIRSS